MKLVAKHRALTLLVSANAGKGTPREDVHENALGACEGEVTDNPVQIMILNRLPFQGNVLLTV